MLSLFLSLLAAQGQDPAPPLAVYAEPSPRGAVRFARPLIVWPIRFAGSVGTPKVEVKLNGRPAEAAYDPVLGAVVYRPQGPLPAGKNTVECIVKVPEQVPFVREWTFDVQPGAVEGPPPPTQSQVEALELVNALRGHHRLEPALPSPELVLAAQAHADYLAANKDVTHDQTAGKPRFLAATVPERLRTFAYPWPAEELVGFATTDVRDSVVAIFGSPYHRIYFMTPGEPDLGVGVNGNYVCLLFGPETEKVAVPSPPDGVGDVPLDWPGGMGFPKRPNQPYGYPILLRHGRDERDVRDLTVSIKAGGKTIAAIVRDGRTDTHMKGGVVAVPEKPLPPRIEVEVRITLTTRSGQTLEFPWSFNTGS